MNTADFTNTPITIAVVAVVDGFFMELIKRSIVGRPLIELSLYIYHDPQARKRCVNLGKVLLTTIQKSVLIILIIR